MRCRHIGFHGRNGARALERDVGFSTPYSRLLQALGAMGGSGTETAFLFCTQTELAYQAGDASFPARLLGLAQSPSDARAAVGSPAGHQERLDGRQQMNVPPATPAPVLVLVSVEAVPGNVQGFGQFGEATIPGHFLHHRISLAGISADKMPNAFFKMPR